MSDQAVPSEEQRMRALAVCSQMFMYPAEDDVALIASVLADAEQRGRDEGAKEREGLQALISSEPRLRASLPPWFQRLWEDCDTLVEKAAFKGVFRHLGEVEEQLGKAQEEVADLRAKLDAGAAHNDELMAQTQEAMDEAIGLRKALAAIWDSHYLPSENIGCWSGANAYANRLRNIAYDALNPAPPQAAPGTAGEEYRQRLAEEPVAEWKAEVFGSFDAKKAEQRGIYVASRASIPQRGTMWRNLRAEGWPIISTWIDEDGPGQTADLGELWDRIRREVVGSAGLILYAEDSDFPLKGALIEVGMALASGVPVVVVAPGVKTDPRSCAPIGSWMLHPLVLRADSPAEAFRMLGVQRALAQPPAAGVAGRGDENA